MMIPKDAGSEYWSVSKVALGKQISQSLEKNWWSKIISILHRAMQKVLFSLKACARTGVDEFLCGKKWKSYLVMISFCCNVPEPNDRLDGKHEKTAHLGSRCSTSELRTIFLRFGQRRYGEDMQQKYFDWDRLENQSTSLLQGNWLGEARVLKPSERRNQDILPINIKQNILQKHNSTDVALPDDQYSDFTVGSFNLV